MGIEKFFLNLKSNKNFNKNITNKTLNDFDFVYIDFNSIVCKSLEEVEQKLNYLNYEIIYNRHNSISEFSEQSKKIIELYNINVLNNNVLNNNVLNNNVLNNNVLNNNVLNNNKIEDIFFNILTRNILLILNETNKEYIKTIYIAFDGIPTMAKIVEQRRRKYTKYILDEIKNKIYKKYELSIDIIRKEFEENRIKLDLTFKLDEHNIKKIINLNNKNIIISNKSEIGEGEKKIFEHISANYNSGSYLIVSPDSDVILLSLLHQNQMMINSINSSFHIIKNIIPIEYINVDNIRLNLIEYSLNRVEKFKIEDRIFFPNECNILYDIIVLIQFLGNDFIPKLNCLTSRSSLLILIDIYIKHITRTKNKFKYLVFNENNIHKLNYENLNSIIFKLSENEHKLLYESYCVNNYKNFNYLLSIFELNNESPFFFDKLTSYIFGVNKIMTYIITNKNTNKDGRDIYDNILDKYKDRDIFIKLFLLIESESNYNLENKSDNDLISDIIELLDKIVISIRLNKNYKGKLRFVKYASSINDSYHLQQIINNLEHPQMIVTDYDKNFYKFEKKLDEYYFILTSDLDLKFGYIDINSKNNYYKLLIDNNIEENKKQFYQEKIKSDDQIKIKEICNSYLLGLFWNFDFYFNKNNHEKNSQYISVWYYDKDVVPFLKDLQIFMKNICGKNNELNKLFYQITNETSSLHVTKSNYLTDIEQYIYITPNMKLYNKISQKYNQLLINQHIFPNINKIIEEILDGNVTKHLDLSNCIYINKCKILGLNVISYNELIKLFIKLRD